MEWISIADALPSGEVLIHADGEYHIAALVGESGDLERAFMDVHSSDILPWPSHWAGLAPPPG